MMLMTGAIALSAFCVDARSQPIDECVLVSTAAAITRTCPAMLDRAKLGTGRCNHGAGHRSKC